MNEFNDNQQSSRRQQHGQPTQDEEHETHTVALVLLVLAVLVVIAVIFAVNRDISNLNPANYGDEVSEPIDNETHGAGIPVEVAQATEQSDVSGLPSGVPVPENATVMQNYESSLGDNGTQRVYMFRTSNPPVSYANQYQQWIASSDFTVDGGDQTGSSFTIRASNESEQLIMNMVDNGSDREVQINYINQSS